MDKGFFKGVVLGAVVSTVVLIAATAFAGSGKGGIFNLGVNNTVDATTKLHGAAQGAMLHVTNAGSEPGSSGLVVGAGSTPPAIRGANSGTGPGVKGTGVSGPGVLGQSTTGTGVQAVGAGSQPALQATNTGTGPGAAFVAGGTAPPFTVSSSTKVTDLNADQLDGIDSTGFVNGGGSIDQNRVELGVDTAGAVLTLPGFGAVEGFCDHTGGDAAAELGFANSSGADLDVWWMNQDGVGFGTVPSNSITELFITPSTPAPYVVVLQVSRDGRTATVTASQRGDSPTGCTMVAQAVGQVAP